MNKFKSYRDIVFINETLKSRHIIAGDYSYYSGYYHGHSFEDCVMYLDKNDNYKNAQDIDRLFIGKFCSIASGVKFMMGGTQGHNYKWISNYPMDIFKTEYDAFNKPIYKANLSKGDTVIGNDVWIGAEAMIMPGITIADGAVIGARSLVTKNIGPYEIWGGNPAKYIKKRFTDEEISKLLKIKWWNFDIETIIAHIDLIMSSDIDRLFIELSK